MATGKVFVSNLFKNYSSVEVLKGVNFELMKGQQYVILGSSGSGKSTLLYMLGGLDRPSSGLINVDGSVLNEMSDSQLASFRNNKVGFVFQFHFLLSGLTCLENILLPSSLSKTQSAKNVKSFCLDVANLLGVTDCLDKKPFQLSGGQQQRVNLIRAVSLRPEFLLCDEPTGSLDSVNTEIVCDFLFKLSRDLNITLVTVTHDQNVATRFEHHYIMKDGQMFKSSHV